MESGIIIQRQRLIAIMPPSVSPRGEKPTFTVADKDSRYVTLRATYPGMHLNHEECHELFNPSMHNLPFLLCRQIVRDIGNSANARGCGILAEQNDNGGVDIVVTLVKSKKQHQ